MADGAQIARAYIQILPSTDKIGITMEKAMNGIDTSKAGEASGNSFASGFGTALAGLTKITMAAVAAAAAGVIAITKEAIASYAQYEQLVGGMETLYKENADKMVKYASEAYKTAGLSANEYMETATAFSASLLASTQGDTEKAAEAANQAIIDMSDNANKMGTSMESIQNAYRGFAKQNYTMLDNLALGYGGTKSEMERLLVDAEKLSGVHYDLNNLNDVYSAIHVIQGELGISGRTAEEAAEIIARTGRSEDEVFEQLGTTAKEASETISGSLSSASAAWQNLLTGFADENANFDELIDALVSSVSTAANNIVPRITKAFAGIGNLVTELAPIFSKMFPELINSLLPPLLEAAATLVMAIVENLQTIIEPIIQELPIVIDMLISVLPDLVSALLNMLPILIEAALEILTNLIEGVAAAVPIIIPQIVDVLIQIVDVIIQNAPLLLSAALSLIQNLGNGMLQAMPELVSKLPEIITGIVETLTSFYPELMEVGVQLLTSLISELPTIITTIVTALPEIIQAIVSFFTENLPVFVDAYFVLLTSLIEALPDIIDALVTAMPDIAVAMVDALLEWDTTFIETGFKLVVSLMKNVPLMIAEIIVALDKIIDGMIETLAAAIAEFIVAGEDIIEGLVKGIKDAKDQVIDAIKRICAEAWETVTEFFHIESPSKKMKWIGEMIDSGLGIGIEDNADIPIKAALGMSEEITSVFDNMNTNINDALTDEMRISSSLSINKNEADDPLVSAIAMLQTELNELNARIESGFGLEWDDRQLGRLVQTYA